MARLVLVGAVAGAVALECAPRADDTEVTPAAPAEAPIVPLVPAPPVPVDAGPTARERFVPRPPLPAAAPDEVVVGASSWGAGRVGSEIRVLPGGRWATWSDGWSVWDPALGWVGTTEELRRPPPRARCGNGLREAEEWRERQHRAIVADPPPGATAADLACIGSGSSMGALRVCRVDDGVALFADGAEVTRWPARSGEPSVAWAADGSAVAWTDDERLGGWTAGGGPWSVRRGVASVAVTTDGTLVVGLTRDGLAIHDAVDGARLDPPHPQPLVRTVLGPAGEIAASRVDGTLESWDPTGRPLGAWSIGEVPGSLAWDARGLWVVTAADTRRFTPTGRLLASRPRPTEGWSVGPHDIGFTATTLSVDGRSVTLPDGGARDDVRVDPSGGQLWYRTRRSREPVFDGEAWVPAYTAFTVDLSTGVVTHGGPREWPTDFVTMTRGDRRLAVRGDGALVVSRVADDAP